MYAALGVHSGLACGAARDLPSAMAAMRGQHTAGPGLVAKSVHTPTIVFHGDRDATVHPRNGGHVMEQARSGSDLRIVVEQGTAPSGYSFTRSVQNDASGRGFFEQWEIHGAGHAWLGGSPAGSFTDPKGPDATREMLRFFLEHARQN